MAIEKSEIEEHTSTKEQIQQRILNAKLKNLIISNKIKKVYIKPDMAKVRLKMRAIMEEERQKKLSRRAIFMD